MKAKDGADLAERRAQALADTGVSRQQAHRYQALADVPKAVFDEALSDPIAIPTTSGVYLHRIAPNHPSAFPG